MKLQSNIIQYIENIASSIKKVEKESSVFEELKDISTELEQLRYYVKATFDTLENNFNSFIRQINMLSELIEFQRSVMNFKSSDKLIHSLFSFLNQNVSADHSFIAFKLKEEDKDYIIVTNNNNEVIKYRQFVYSPGIGLLTSIVQERDMGYLISDVKSLAGEEIDWNALEAKSAILFPIKVQGKFLGFGCLIQKEKPFELSDLSFINLVIGLISLVIYQHYYFTRLKSRLFKQFRLRKMLEEVKYAEYFEKGPLYIFTLDPRYVVLHANTAALSNLKINEEMIIGDNFLELIPRNYQAGLRKVLDSAEEGHIQYYRAPVKNGDEVNSILEFYISKIELQNHFTLILVFAVDITQIYYRDQLAHRNEVLDELDQLSRSLVGEFNNLLTMVVPNLSLMRSQLPADHPLQKNLSIMEKATGRSNNLVQKFLNYDLEEFETYDIGNINNVIKSFVTHLKKEIPKGIHLQYHLDAGLKPTIYYPLRLRQLLKLLVDNSVAALENRPDPEIRVSTKYIQHPKTGLLAPHPFYLNKGEYIELTVFDNGVGIPDKILAQVFKPFYSTKIKNEGVGLGLFIAYNIVKDMSGQIFIESRNGEFTSVYVYLPIKEEPSMPIYEVEKAAFVETEQEKKEKLRPTLLVVDDEYNIRSMMKEIMEMYGFKVLTAGNGQEGVDIYKKHQNEIDLVILDMLMPVMDGRAAFNEIIRENPKQKVFIISGYSQKEDLEDILEKGAIGYMRKPFKVGEIVNKVKEIMNIRD